MVEEIKTTNNNSLWKISAVVFAVLFVVALIIAFRGTLTGHVINSKNIGTQALDFFNTQLSQTPGTLVSVNSISGIYRVIIEVSGKQYPLYFTKDGNWIEQGSDLVSVVPAKTTATGNVVANTNSDKDKCSQDVATRFGIDIAKVEALAFSSDGINLLKEEQKLDIKYGVRGSPTLIINGVESKAIYTGTEATKSAICSSFTVKPSECDGVTINNTGVKKSEKPLVELFVMSYCPYGVRAENNVAPLQELFGDKIDLKIRFIVQVSGSTIDSVQSLHGLTEAKEDARQLAIMQIYPDKYWTYLKEFNNVCYGGGAASSGSC